MSYPDMTVFGHDPWWLILIKAVAIFAFLLLTVLAAILIERKILGRMQMRYGPNRVGPFGLMQPSSLRSATRTSGTRLSPMMKITTDLMICTYQGSAKSTTAGMK